jgi:HEAT repeat protein
MMIHTTPMKEQGMTMKTRKLVGFVASLTACWGMQPVQSARADEPTEVVVYDRARGELSPGTDAPTRESMMNAIQNASPTRLYATLEYGERVECFECIPLLSDKLLASDDAQVREIAAWWLRRRSFGFGPVMARMRGIATDDSDAVKRARAASALGEFLDPHAQPTLARVATKDRDAAVRVAGVRALGRLNVVSGLAALSSALQDADAQVRKAALDQVLKVSFFSDTSTLLGTLSDADTSVRQTAAQLAGELRLMAAVDPLLGLLMTDDSPQVRQAAAIALGRIGGSDALAGLSDAKPLEHDDGVLGAIDIAGRMR